VQPLIVKAQSKARRDQQCPDSQGPAGIDFTAELTSQPAFRGMGELREFSERNAFLQSVSVLRTGGEKSGCSRHAKRTRTEPIRFRGGRTFTITAAPFASRTHRFASNRLSFCGKRQIV